jgi:hypothetical protein
MRRIVPIIGLILAILAAAFLFFQGASRGGDGSQPNEQPTSGLTSNIEKDENVKTGLPALSSSLNELLSGWESSPEAAASQALDSGLDLDQSRVKVTVVLIDESYLEPSAQLIQAIGGEVIVQFETLIDAWVPVAALELLAKLDGISQVREPLGVVPLDP